MQGIDTGIYRVALSFLRGVAAYVDHTLDDEVRRLERSLPYACCLFVCLLACLFACLLVCLLVFLFVCLFVFVLLVFFCLFVELATESGTAI